VKEYEQFKVWVECAAFFGCPLSLQPADPASCNYFTAGDIADMSRVFDEIDL